MARSPSTHPLRRAAAILAIATIAAGCASGPAEPSAEDTAAIDAADVALVGQDDLTWDRTEVEAEAGTITFALTCEQAANHDVAIDGERIAVCRPGETATGEVDLEAGTYEYVCTVPGHEQRMRGTLTVR